VNALDEQTILASEENFGNVSVCQGGVVHVNLVHMTIKFLPGDFEKFAQLISRARMNLEAGRPTRSKPRLQVVSPEPPGEEPTDSQD
jgi:hypothetical protein